MGTTERRERERAELRQKILEAARDLFMEDGAASVTMRKIAERIEYSPTAIYAHFPDKEALLLALCEHDFSALLSEGAHLFEIKDPIERITRTCLFYVQFALCHQRQYEFMFMTAGLDLVILSDAAIAVYEAARGAVMEAMTAGRFRPQWSEPSAVLYALWAAIHGIAALQIAGRYELMQRYPQLRADGEDLSPQHIAEVAITSMLAGFLNENSSAASPAARVKGGVQRVRKPASRSMRRVGPRGRKTARK